MAVLNAFFFIYNLQLDKTVLTISESLCVGTESEISFISHLDEL